MQLNCLKCKLWCHFEFIVWHNTNCCCFKVIDILQSNKFYFLKCQCMIYTLNCKKLCLVKKIVHFDLRLNLHSFFASKKINEQQHLVNKCLCIIKIGVQHTLLTEEAGPNRWLNYSTDKVNKNSFQLYHKNIV